MQLFKFFPRSKLDLVSKTFMWISAMQMEELRAESQISDSSGTIGRTKGATVASSQQQISVTVVTEFVRWNEEAITRCNLFSSQVNSSTITLSKKKFFSTIGIWEAFYL
jgi:hypothetical protein